MARKTRRYRNTGHARSYARIAHNWAIEAVDDDGRKHNKFARLAAKRHLDDLEKTASDGYLYVFDEWHANDVCDFVEKMPHIEGTWETETITLEPVQIFILCAAFGWRRKNDGLRRFTSVYLEMARKGAKSTLTAAVGLYCLACEDEVGPQILVGATTGDQAQKVFKPAKTMTDRSQQFREAFGMETWQRSITCESNGGSMQPINAKSGTQDGHNPHMGILDELHAHKDRGLYDVIKSAFGSRKNPLLWMVTTAGYNSHGVCYEQRKLVAKILDGLVEIDHYFGIIFTLDEDDDPLDPAVWVKANPMLGVTPTLESMTTYAKEAENAPGTMAEFKTKRLNIWTAAKMGWLDMGRWKRCRGDVDLAALKDVDCYGGLDLASTRDITAFVLIWVVDGELNVLPRMWVPEDIVEDRLVTANVPYDVWHKQGYLITTPGAITDYAYIEKEIRSLMDRFKIRAIGFDRWNSSQLVTVLEADGAPMVRVAQGPRSFNEPMKELERHMFSGTLRHSRNPVLSWMASNVVVRRDVNQNMAPDRGNCEEKIDGIVALLDALYCFLQVREAEFDPVAAIG